MTVLQLHCCWMFAALHCVCGSHAMMSSRRSCNDQQHLCMKILQLCLQPLMPSLHARDPWPCGSTGFIPPAPPRSVVTPLLPQTFGPFGCCGFLLPLGFATPVLPRSLGTLGPPMALVALAAPRFQLHSVPLTLCQLLRILQLLLCLCSGSHASNILAPLSLRPSLHP